MPTTDALKGHFIQLIFCDLGLCYFHNTTNVVFLGQLSILFLFFFVLVLQLLHYCVSLKKAGSMTTAVLLVQLYIISRKLCPYHGKAMFHYAMRMTKITLLWENRPNKKIYKFSFDLFINSFPLEPVYPEVTFEAIQITIFLPFEYSWTCCIQSAVSLAQNL